MEKRQEVRNLKRTIERCDKSIIASFKDIANLKSSNSTFEEGLLILNALGCTNTTLIQRLFRIANGEKVEQKYPPEIRSFVLTLHYYSRRAYNYVRDKFQKMVLPHEKTLCRWYQGIP